MRKTLIAGCVAAFLVTSAHAENSACWGDYTRTDISCTRITETLLLSFRGQTKDVIRKSMNAPGRETENGLHFLSNYSRGEKAGSGDVNVTFEDGRATIVGASVDSPGHVGQFDFIWNAYAAPAVGDEFDRSTKNFRREPFCSDFTGRPARYNSDDDMDRQLTLFQMQNGSTKAELRRVLEVSCNPGHGLAVSDPAGDCQPSTLRIVTAIGVSWANAVGRIGSVVGSKVGGQLLSFGWGLGAVFNMAAVPALMAIAIFAKGRAETRKSLINAGSEV